MNKQIFREKSINKINSPEKLNDVLKVTNPSIWLILCAIVVFLGGVIFWSIKSDFQSSVPGVISIEKGIISLYVSDEVYGIVPSEAQITMTDYDYEVIGSIEKGDKGELLSIKHDSFNHSFIINTLGLEKEEGIDDARQYKVIPDFATLEELSLPDGLYETDVIIDVIKPISFLADN